MILKGRDIVITGQQPWDVEIGSNCKNIAEEFSKYNRVLYVNAPLDRITILRGRNDPKVQKRLSIKKGKKKNIEQINPNLWILYPDVMLESINWIKNDFLFNLLNRENNKRLAKAIKRAIEPLHFKNYLLFNDNDIFRCFYLKEFLKPEKSIYYSRDFLLTVDYWKYHGKKYEPLLIAKSDLCVANSLYLTDYCKRYNPSSYYVGQGCELDIFSNFNGSVPQELKQLSAPKIGYVGALQSIRLDIELLIYIAQQNLQWQIVLVGPEDDEFKSSVLHRLTNVHFLGQKKAAKLPAYIQGFDVCLNPQLINEITIGNYPRKIDEYLAMGKPVVATKTPAMEIFNQHTYLAESYNDYCTLIQAALSEDNLTLQQQRKDFASLHTWEKSVNEIYAAIINTAS